MAGLKRLHWERYEICFPADMEAPVEPSALIDSLGDARSLEKKGRGGIRITNIAGKPVACRKYIHGGLFRGITGDIFFSGKRAINEFQIMLYLQERSFPIVSPYCVIIEERLLTKNLYILTYYKEDAGRPDGIPAKSNAEGEVQGHKETCRTHVANGKAQRLPSRSSSEQRSCRIEDEGPPIP